MGYEKELATALHAVRQACALCISVRTKVDVSSIQKSDRSPVTIADFGSQAAIIHELRNVFPDDAVVAEENAQKLRENQSLCEQTTQYVKTILPDITVAQMLSDIDYGTRETDSSQRFWTLDPIDGTKGFLRNDQYAVALALLENGKVVLGVLGCPSFQLDASIPSTSGSLFWAVKGQRAMAETLEGNGKTQIQVDDLEDIESAQFCESVENNHSAHDQHLRIASALGIKRPSYRLDSQVKYAAVASGLVSIYFRIPRGEVYREKIWDHAAGSFIVEAAGGRVTDLKGRLLDFTAGRTLDNNTGVLATNGRFHDAVLDAVARSRY